MMNNDHRRRCSIAVFGAGGHSKVIVATLRSAGFRVGEVYDEDVGKVGQTVLGHPIRSIVEAFNEPPLRAVIAIGSNASRMKIAARFLETEWVSLTHPSAVVDPSVSIGPGTVIFAGAIIQPDTTIGAHCIINTGSTVDHDCILGDFVHLAPGSHLAGGVRVDEGGFVGVGACAIPGVRVQSWSTLGAGALALSDVPPSTTVVGVPGRPIGPSGIVSQGAQADLCIDEDSRRGVRTVSVGGGGDSVTELGKLSMKGSISPRPSKGGNG